MNTFAIRTMGPRVRCHWSYDETHETRGSYCYETEAETREAEETELANLASGKWVAAVCTVAHECPNCSEWTEGDQLHGIVLEATDAELDAFARHSMNLEPHAPLCERCTLRALLLDASAHLFGTASPLLRDRKELARLLEVEAYKLKRKS